jgi:glycogen debranching enzyme
MWTLIGTYNYVLYTNDTTFLNKNWAKYTTALNFIMRKIDMGSGLLNVTGTRDWARWQTSGKTSESNMMCVSPFRLF